MNGSRAIVKNAQESVGSGLLVLKFVTELFESDLVGLYSDVMKDAYFAGERCLRKLPK